MASSTGSSLSLILSDGSIVSSGYNGQGELGLGHTSAVRVFTPVPSAGVNNKKVVHAGNTSGCSYILKSNGDLYGTGYNLYGELGLGHKDRALTYTFLMSGVSDITVAAYSAMILKIDGTVWVAGYNNSGSLGLGHTSPALVWTQVTALGNDNSFVCRGQYYNSYVIKKDGRLFHTGNASYSPGVGGSTSFIPVPSMGNDNLLVASAYGAIFLKTDGRVFSFGSFHGGKSNNVTPTHDPELGTDNVSVMASQNNGYYALKSNGEIWGIASTTGYYVYTGISSTTKFTKATKFGNDNVDFALNRSVTGFLALKQSGLVYGAGMNSQGQLGLGNTTTYTTPQILFDGEKVIGISGTASTNRIGISVMVSYSNDGTEFSPFEYLDPSNLPQARYLKFKGVFGGGMGLGKMETFEFDQSNPETKVELNDFLESVNTDVKPKILHTQEMIEDKSYTDGELFIATIDKSIFKKITKLEVK